jgi:hypothetical protein
MEMECASCEVRIGLYVLAILPLEIPWTINVTLEHVGGSSNSVDVVAHQEVITWGKKTLVL